MSISLSQSAQSPPSQRHASRSLYETTIPMEGNSSKSKQGFLISSLASNQETLISIFDEDISMLSVPVLQPLPREIDLLSHDLVDTSIYNPVHHTVQQNENLHGTDEDVTRTFQTTPNQKAQKAVQKSRNKFLKKNCSTGRLELPNVPVFRQTTLRIDAPRIDPVPHFISELASSYNELLQGLRGFQGELVVQADFGRILLKNVLPKHIAQGEQQSSYDPDHALAYLKNPHVTPLAIFTKVLTVLPADIIYLVATKDRQGNFMWKQDLPLCDVFYEILCIDHRPSHNSQPFSIEVHGEKLLCLAKTRRDFGAIHVHGVKRYWDFRISATGMEAETNRDSAYQDFAKVIENSLQIPCVSPSIYQSTTYPSIVQVMG